MRLDGYDDLRGSVMMGEIEMTDGTSSVAPCRRTRRLARPRREFSDKPRADAAPIVAPMLGPPELLPTRAVRSFFQPAQ